MKKSQEKALYSIPGWEDFLSQDFTKEFLSFEEARNYVHNLELNGSEAWFKWCKSGDKPDDIPACPSRIYKDSGWISWGDFLGTGNVHKKKFRSFEDARKFARNLKLSGSEAWRKWSKSSERPDDIPAAPSRTYKDSGWFGMGDFLGTGNVASKNRKYRSFEEARKFVRNLKLSGSEAWFKWCKSSGKPNDITAVPNRTYKDSGWVSWGDFLGTGRIATLNLKFRSFEEAKEFVHGLKLNSVRSWNKWRKSGERQDDIPTNPNRTYRNSWVSWGDWLGKR